MKSRKAESVPPLQFGIRTLLLATVVGAVICSAATVLGWSWELIGLVAPLACFAGYQMCYALVSRWLLRGSWDGARHGWAVMISLAVVCFALLTTLVVAAMAIN